MKEAEVKQLDQMALRYAESKDESYFNRLFEKVKPSIQKEARDRERRYQMPASDVESVYSQALWNAARNFNGETNILQRLTYFSEPAMASTLRYHLAKKRNPSRTISLDQILDEEDGNHKEFLPSLEPFEQSVIEEMDIKKILDGYAKTNEHYGAIIRLLYADRPKNEIARTVFGTNKYDARCRKGVQRAKQHFRAYLQGISQTGGFALEEWSPQTIFKSKKQHNYGG
ncbi:hypothetical protein [Heliophilum fasciatum]|uniref:Uncharacterized protein n=1 Tax=Heliophilum fasciatum TaxID=35700 RepID=A0A4R2RHT7_9FIRM|nr:hypothetical protein [Heliophilum fasciatum]MCW2278697.1 DNA-directed RNA polymerase specialized sigma subunit [Heliophilum fasciatum]TCP62563.1 hypothetical protein EDD73_12161 [Heliophilum fasciatum]